MDGFQKNMSVRYFSAYFGASLFAMGAIPAPAQSTDAENPRAAQAITAVRTLCLVGTQFDLKADSSGNLTFLKLTPGALGSVTVNVRQSSGAAAIFDDKVRQVADEKIRNCIEPYIGRIVDAILNGTPSVSNVKRDSGPEPGRPLPHAVPGKFNVAIVHLENDNNHEIEQLIRADLARHTRARIEPMVFDRLIAPPRDTEEKHRLEGDRQARELLQQSGADVLIWGEVLKGGIPQLYWTVSKYNAQEEPPEPCKIVDDIALPPIFWHHLTDVLELLVVNASTNLMRQTGRNEARQLDLFIDKVRTLVKSSDSAEWNARSRARVLAILASALTASAEQSGHNEGLREAIEFFSESLNNLNQAQGPLEWAGIQVKLGISLWMLGVRTQDSNLLLAAQFAFEQALHERTHDKVPLDWAATENYLGNVLEAEGARAGDPMLLQFAVDAYNLALSERTLNKASLDWAATETALALALVNLGQSLSNLEMLQNAVDACNGALTIFTRAKMPLYWAKTENNLGIALGALGQAESNVQRLDESVDAIQSALSELTRQKIPYYRAAAETNLGIALEVLGGLKSDASVLARAAHAFEASMKDYEQSEDVSDMQVAQQHLQEVQLELTQQGLKKL